MKSTWNFRKHQIFWQEGESVCLFCIKSKSKRSLGIPCQWRKTIPSSQLGSPVSDEKSSLPVSWDRIPPQWRKIITSSQLGYPVSNEKSTLPVSWRMANDKAGQVQSELSAGGTKRDVENIPEFTCQNCILVRWSSLGPPPVGRRRTKLKLNFQFIEQEIRKETNLENSSAHCAPRPIVPGWFWRGLSCRLLCDHLYLNANVYYISIEFKFVS